MSRASRLAIAASCAALHSACGLPGGGAPPPTARGVVLVLAAGLGGVDASRLPGLARLAAQGRRFDRAFAPDPDPARARTALLGEGEHALAASLRSRGVAVASLAAADALPLDAAPAALSLSGSAADPAVAGRLEAWLRERPRFVLVASIGPARAPVPPPATLAGAFAPSLPRIAVADLAFSDPPGGELAPAAWSEPARQRAEAARLERAIAADRELAALVSVVERAAPDAAVVVVSDPPSDAGAHGRLDDGALFDDGLRATMVVRAAGLSRPGRASARLVSTLDAAATVLDLLGIASGPDAGASRSLMPLLASPDAAGQGAVVSSLPRKAGRLGRSVRDARFRFTEWPDGSRELYDHELDPGENRNLAAEPQHAATLLALQRELRERTVRPATSESGGAASERGAAPGGGAQARAGAARPLSVVLVIVDDLGTRVGAWGAPVATPAIDRLAARGVRFEHAYAQVAMCSPSRVSMLTGWRPDRTGIWQNEDPPRPKGAVPLQEHFAAHGAFTASIGKVYHSPLDFHWDLREEHPDVVEERDPSAAGEGTAGLWVKAPGGDLDQPDGRRARRAAALVAAGARRPFFLALGLVRPHVRWVAPERYFGLYPPESIAPVPVVADLGGIPAIAVKTQPQPLPGLPLLGREPPGLVHDPGFLRQATAAYQACVSFADAQLGALLDALDRHDLWKDTVVVLAGDNGFHLGEHGGLLRKDTLFEEALHVPLVVAAPGLPAGTVVEAPVELLDLYPTLVELAGISAPPGLDGESLVPLALGRAQGSRGAARSWRRVQPPQRGYSIRTDALRYTLWPDGSEELYDRRGREPESENLAARADWSARKKLMRDALEQSAAPPR